MVQLRQFRAAATVLVLAGGLAVGTAGPAGAASSDVAAAAAGTIQKRDVPKDYKKTASLQTQAGPPPAGEGEASFEEQTKDIPACADFKEIFEPSSPSITASADGASFDQGGALTGSELSGSTLVFSSTAAAKKFFAPIKSAQYATCLEDAMQASMAQGADDTTTYQSTIEPTTSPKLGDESVAFRIAVAATSTDPAAPFTTDFHFQFVYSRVGRGIGVYVALSMGDPDPAASAKANTAAVARFERALG
ncbi:MAG: hypothetical protein U0W40_12475 [Acidimicrobiia bacterium]